MLLLLYSVVMSSAAGAAAVLLAVAVVVVAVAKQEDDQKGVSTSQSHHAVIDFGGGVNNSYTKIFIRLFYLFYSSFFCLLLARSCLAVNSWCSPRPSSSLRSQASAVIQCGSISATYLPGISIAGSSLVKYAISSAAAALSRLEGSYLSRPSARSKAAGESHLTDQPLPHKVPHSLCERFSESIWHRRLGLDKLIPR